MLDDLRQHLADVDVSARAAKAMFSEEMWQTGDVDRRHLNRLEELISAAASAAERALEAVDELVAAALRERPHGTATEG